jgi:agmatine/peptidylarginine deiminase
MTNNAIFVSFFSLLDRLKVIRPFLDYLSPFINFKNVEIMLSKEICGENKSIENSLIVLSASLARYKSQSPEKRIEIIDCLANFANIVSGKDEVVILADADAITQFKGKVPSNILIQAVNDNIWIRDFAPVIPTKQVKFKYLPSYNPKLASEQTDKNFQDWFVKTGLEYYAKSDIILEGGNVVDNVAGTRVVVTDRILQSNPSLTKQDAKNELKQLLGINEIAIIPASSDDATGHADGLVMWPMDDKILLLRTGEPTHTEIVTELKSSFPSVEIVEVPDFMPNTISNNFSSAHNCFVNSIVTDGYIYMPTFNDPHDAEMLELFKSHSNKTIVPIPAENVAIFGGSVRCMSWQVKGTNKMKILQLIKQ